jgi:HEAT repeats
MMVATLSVVLIVAQSAAGWHEPVIDDGRTGGCQACGVESGWVVEQLVRLQRGATWLERERGARSLRQLDGRCHPEVLGALAYSLLHDPNRSVRREVAETLVKLGACDPTVHQAMKRAATCDPSLLTRLWARKGLSLQKRRCEGACGVCATPGEIIVDLPDSGTRGSGQVIAPEPAGIPSVGIESAPSLAPLDEPTEPAPRATPGPALDSSVKPRPAPPGSTRDADKLAPLPDPEDDATPAARKPEARVTPAPRTLPRRPVALGRWVVPG